MKVLVTGGAGFIGSHTVEALIETGAMVRVLDNLSTGKRQNLPSHTNIELFEGDIRVQQDVAKAMKETTHVLHLAAQVSVQASVEDPPTSCSQNIQGFVNVLAGAKAHQIQRFVYASSAAVYGIPQRVPISEEDVLDPISPYGLEKSINEQYGRMFSSLFQFSSMGLRYFNVYGPRQDPASPYAGVISKFLECIQKKQPLSVFGDGQQTRDFIFVKDIAQANVKALQGKTTQTCNVGTGKSWTLLEMIDALSRAVGQPLEVKHLAPRGGDIVHSSAKVTRIKEQLGFSTDWELVDGLKALATEFGVVPPSN
jgi:UDP-glucose 4-epimerase